MENLGFKDYVGGGFEQLDNGENWVSELTVSTQLPGFTRGYHIQWLNTRVHFTAMGMVRTLSENFGRLQFKFSGYSQQVPGAAKNFNEASDFPDYNKAQQVSQVRLVSGQIFVRGVTNSQTA